MDLLPYIQRIPAGYSEAFYKGKKYGLSKEIFNQGKSFKIFAEELGGNDFISFNYYLSSKKEYLKPCEMPAEKVIAFLKEAKVK
ncbi:MAG: peptide methionine sulfoxide reductase [Bacteroidia bacterium]|nr:peptide methionine sulfoxide reductase [Bacteroidia bacterium]